MAQRKTAIAMSADLLDAIDDAARERGESRSRFIGNVLRMALRARRDAAITRRLNELFSDPKLSSAQAHTTSSLRRFESDWDEERW